MKEQVINISDWESFDDLHKAQIEIDAYLSILYFLKDKGVSVEDDLYQYYEKLYINLYFKYFDLKDEFVHYLENRGIQSVGWTIDFFRNEVRIFEE